MQAIDRNIRDVKGLNKTLRSVLTRGSAAGCGGKVGVSQEHGRERYFTPEVFPGAW